MDASAYLTRHGWTGGGLGYSQSGIKKPLLASQKHASQKGLGGKPLGGHSDQWWLGAFDAGLKSLGTDKPAVGPAILQKGPAYFKAELYRNFVKGEGLTGTILEQSVPASIEDKGITKVALSTENCKKDRKRSKKVKTTPQSSSEETEKGEKKNRKKQRRNEASAEQILVRTRDPDADNADEKRKRKEERRARKEEKRRRKAQKARQDG